MSSIISKIHPTAVVKSPTRAIVHVEQQWLLSSVLSGSAIVALEDGTLQLDHAAFISYDPKRKPIAPLLIFRDSYNDSLKMLVIDELGPKGIVSRLFFPSFKNRDCMVSSYGPSAALQQLPQPNCSNNRTCYGVDGITPLLGPDGHQGQVLQPPVLDGWRSMMACAASIHGCSQGLCIGSSLIDLLNPIVLDTGGQKYVAVHVLGAEVILHLPKAAATPTNFTVGHGFQMH